MGWVSNVLTKQDYLPAHKKKELILKEKMIKIINVK
jgi:hypothetical protein